MSEVKFANVSNPAAFGVEWSAGENGCRFQLVNVRGTTGLMFGMKAPGRDRWSSMAVVDPSRFLEATPRTYGDFLKVAHAYVA
ncbi:hypothetical protein ALI22I_33840 [Saccharothrix sp. ALI-22-I]|uniref:hypothetical protein n=1 Tax=Saccharothrix sp. ALI-22-I TaxID=1933778 RepID=UPI0009D420C3|nr:hypothetical protein [Saccharothrix sp. ALI-22-I]ONI83481.1 hypothetical protein ALI22I_33840 [Saccharothrix sp. ALI-22-I]